MAGTIPAVAIVLSAIAAMFLPQFDLEIIQLAALVTYVLTSMPELRRAARLFVILALALTLLLQGGPGLPQAIGTATFLMALFLALSLVAEMAARSADTVRIAQSILNYPISRIYLPLTLTAHLFSIVLNVGSVAVLLPLVGARAGGLAKPDQFRSLSLAVMRGFAAMPMWAPFSVSIALTLSIFREVHFLDLVPFGLAMAVFYMLSGWVLDGWKAGGPPATRAAAGDAWPLLRLLMRIVAMAAGAYVCEQLLGVRFIEGVLLGALATALAWWLGHQWRGRGGTSSDVPAGIGQSGGGNNEIVIIGAAGFTGSLLSASLASIAVGLDTLPPNAVSLLLAVVPVFILGSGWLGLSPIVSGSIVGGLLVALTLPQDQLFAALALLAGWGLTSSGSPFTGGVLMASRLIAVSPVELAGRWNGAFCLANALLVGLILLVSHMLVVA